MKPPLFTHRVCFFVDAFLDVLPQNVCQWNSVKPLAGTWRNELRPERKSKTMTFSLKLHVFIYVVFRSCHFFIPIFLFLALLVYTLGCTHLILSWRSRQTSARSSYSWWQRRPDDSLRCSWAQLSLFPMDALLLVQMRLLFPVSKMIWYWGRVLSSSSGMLTWP